MMDFSEFREEIVKMVKKNYPEKDISVMHLGGEKYNLVITSDTSRVVPTPRLNSFYEDYCKSGDIDRIVEDVYEALTKSVIPDFNIARISDYAFVKDKIRLKVCKGDYRLNEHVYRKFLNMLILVYIDLGEGDFGCPGARATIQVNEKVLDLWGITEDTLFQDATQNEIVAEEASLCKMDEIVKDYMELPETPFYVLTNKERLNGARLILQTSVLDDICKKLGNDVYIVPSSIHEVLLLPIDYGITAEELQNMLVEVNSSHVEPDEVLSDKLLKYAVKEGKVTFAL